MLSGFTNVEPVADVGLFSDGQKPEYGCELDPDFWQTPPALRLLMNEGVGNPRDARLGDVGMTNNGGVKLVGAGLQLDGVSGSFVSVPDSPPLRPATQVSMLMGFRAAAISGANYTHLIFKKQSSSLASYGLWINPSRQLYMEIDDGSVHSLTGNTVLSPGVDYRIAATYDGVTQRLFINGVQDASAALNGVTIGYGAFPVKIGGGDFNLFFNGLIYDASILPFALSAGQVALLAANPYADVLPYDSPMFSGSVASGLLLRRRRAAA
jgi:hypothetical protein